MGNQELVDVMKAVSLSVVDEPDDVLCGRQAVVEGLRRAGEEVEKISPCVCVAVHTDHPFFVLNTGGLALTRKRAKVQTLLISSGRVGKSDHMD